MSLEERLEDLRRVYPRASLKRDGTFQLILVPDLPIEVGGLTLEMDVLLCPGPHSGYTTRLFLASSVADRLTNGGKVANWTAHAFFGRTWHSWSWQHVSADQPLLAMLACHLAALR